MPPTTDEIDAAAGRLRRLRTANRIAPTFMSSLDEAVRSADLHTLADAWLAANPPDDSLPVDADWFESLNWAARGINGYSVLLPPATHDAAIAELYVDHDGLVTLCQGMPDDTGGADDMVLLTSLPVPATRGQLRRLLAALGVPRLAGEAVPRG